MRALISATSAQGAANISVRQVFLVRLVTSASSCVILTSCWVNRDHDELDHCVWAPRNKLFRGFVVDVTEVLVVRESVGLECAAM